MLGKVACPLFLSLSAAGAELPAPALPILLTGGAWGELELTLDTAAPAGTLTRDGKPYPLLGPKLTVSSSSSNGPIAKAEYRLRFAIDSCAHSPPTEPNQWPGLCGYPDGGVRPVRLTRYELLLSRTRVTPDKVSSSDAVDAACVPDSGEGPSCQLHGTVAELSGGMRVRNGAPYSAPKKP